MFLPVEPVINYCTQQDGVLLCQLLHEKLEPLGYFPALTGGLLYKEGNRKDIDIVIYRHRQKIESFEIIDITKALSEVGVKVNGYHGFVTKAEWKGFIVDIFNPETNDTENELIYQG